ncbi:hypothetical protein Y032_0075g956 [Ancylostoma ceylanicum]|uniref:Uncharacterized protein n=1 Tax=Ancylostoma ceylanicum TaxID=53326 RepID=A0A016TUV7_9BILA|nr:hypothetical protein Y032_0075g956 [Ancylostoma ceylanicum]
MRVAGLTFTHFNLLAQQIRADEKMAKTLGQRIPSKSCCINEVYDKVQKTLSGNFKRESDQKRFVIQFVQQLVKTAYSHENWIFVTVLSRDRRNNMIELDTRSIMKECFSDFMISTCHGDNIGVSTNSEDIMMAGFTSPL